MTIRGRIMTTPKWKSAFVGLALVAAPASVAARPAEPVTQPSADQLAAAQRLMNALMPEEQREAMIEQMISSLMTNLMSGIKQGIPGSDRLAGSAAEPVLERFIERQKTLSIAQMKIEMPSMIDATASAYARRFSVAQLDEMYAFFRTPTGQHYVMESMTIMSDPDVAEWQRASMTKTMEKMPEEMKLLIKELEEALGRPAEEEDA